MEHFPDHPDIAMALETGHPNLVRWPRCPVCGEIAETFFKRGPEIVGCDFCITEADAWEETA